ncbi:MAG: cysteine rich repeat-containing protein [Elusimicrobiota bacterium]
MSKLLLGLFVASFAASARANPMLDKCLPFAPQVCGLTEKSTPDEFLSCFETVKLDVKKAGPAACAEELAHARVHNACNTGDIPKLCAGVKPGENRTMNCLRKNRKQLSKDCGKALKDYDALAAPKPEAGEKKKGRGHSGVGAVRC